MSESIHEPLPKTKTPESLPPPPPRRGARTTATAKQTLDAISARHAPPSKDVEHVRAALGFVERSARDGLAELEALTKDQSPRDALVVKIAVEVGHAAEDLVMKLGELAPHELAMLRTEANAAADAVLELRAWVRSRAPNAKMVEYVESLVHDLDPALRRIGVVPISQRRTVELKDDETAESKAENVRVTQAQQDLLAAIDAEHQTIVTGIVKFCQDQMIEDEEDPPSFVEAVAKSLVIAAVGHLIGENVGKLIGRLAKRTKREVGDKVMERIVNVSTDFVQGFGGELVAAKQRSDKVETQKAMHYFATALQISAHKLAFEQAKVVNAVVAAGAADPATLDAESKARTANLEKLALTYSRTAAQLWTSYQAQSTLGTHALTIQRRKISNMTDYFGEHNETGRVFGTGHHGTHGVARLDVTITPEDGDVSVGKFEIAGSNSVIAEHVAAHSGGQLDRIWLPKEVTVLLKQYRAVIAIDETNRVRDSIGWEDIARAFPEHAVLGSPYRFWAHVRGTKV